MNLLIKLSVAVNVILIIFFVAVCIISLKKNTNPKLKAKFATMTGVSIFLYLICLLSLSIVGILTKNYIEAGLIFYVIMPFIIGHFVNYKTLKIFSVIQLVTFIMSFYTLLTLLV